jgi:hypothetical protein
LDPTATIAGLQALCTDICTVGDVPPPGFVRSGSPVDNFMYNATTTYSSIYIKLYIVYIFIFLHLPTEMLELARGPFRKCD